MQESGLGNQPLFRFCLLLFQCLFIIGISSDAADVMNTIFLYLKAFFVSLAVGFVLYLGFYSHLIPYTLLERFSVLTQIGYGFLRFSPGSYPNEYGIVSSFVLSILTWMILEYRSFQPYFSKKFLIGMYFLTLIALLLTTTRTAYLAYIFTLLWMAWKKRHMVRVVATATSVLLIIFLFLSLFGIDMTEVLTAGFAFRTMEGGTLQERWTNWSKAAAAFSRHPFFGEGFSAHIDLHNLYFQILFELGIVGCAILVGVILLFLWDKKVLRFTTQEPSFEHRFIHTITVSGFIHVLLFGMTNHNLNHHLTWLVLFFSLSLRRERILGNILADDFG